MKTLYVLEQNAWLIYEDLHGWLFVACAVDNYGELCIMVPWNFTAKQSHRSQLNTVHTCFLTPLDCQSSTKQCIHYHPKKNF